VPIAWVSLQCFSDILVMAPRTSSKNIRYIVSPAFEC